MERFLAQCLKQRLLVIIGFVLCVIGGLVAFNSLPIDAFPDLSNNQVQVLTDAPGMGPADAEQLVTIPIEAMMSGLPHVKAVRSLSKLGLSVVTVVFEENVNTYFARQLVNERVQTARSRLPAGLNPELGPITTGMGEIYQYVVSGPGYSAMQLKTLHDWDIKYPLRTVPGVNEVNSWGGLTQEYQVVLYPERLQQYGLTLTEVFDALQANNDNFSGGVIEHNDEQYTVRGLGRVNSLADIGNIVVKRTQSTPVFIRNVAQVQLGAAFRQGAATQNGKGEVVTGMVMMLKGENSRNVLALVKDKLRQIQTSLPTGVRIIPYYDQTHLVEQTLHTVQSNLLEGGVLVVAVLLLMLGNLRAALIVALTIPIALMFSFMGMKAMGITANIMSLGALDFGMIVDGSIVMMENTLRKLAHASASAHGAGGGSTLEIIQQSVQEMARPIIFGVLIIAVVYMPILALEGMEYKMFSPMVFTVTFALLGSLLVALLLVPVLSGVLLRGNITEKESILIRWLRQPYLRLLDRAMRHRKLTLGIAVLGFLLTMASVPFLGTEFVPKLDEGDFIVEVRNLPSIALTEAVAVSTRIEHSIQDIPEVLTVVSKTGRPDLATDPMGVYQTDVLVRLQPKDRWRAGLSKAGLRDLLSTRLQAAAPGSAFNFTQPVEMRVNELVSGIRADIAIKLFGEEMPVLVKKAQEIEAVMRTVSGQTDLQTEKLTGSRQLLVVPDRLKMARYGINVADIRNVLDTAIIGKPVSEVLEGRRRFTLRVRFPQGSQLNPDQLGSLLLESASGQRLPLAQVATVQTGEGLEVIQREKGQHRIIIQMNVRGRDIGSFVREGQAKIRQHVTLPQGYTLDWGGQFENQQRATQKLMLVVPVSVLVIFLLLMATFSNLKDALLVLLNVPFALIGGVLALWLRGMYLSVPASVGFIALFGVAILNGLVLVSTINQRRAEGLTLKAAIVEGAETRLRPVLMTALVASLGFMPMALASGAGAEIQKPLATVVIGGLLTSTLLTLVVLPVLYSWTKKV